MAKTAPDYPAAAREAFLEAHYGRGEPWTRVVKLMRAGELTPSLPAYPKMSFSTARRWKDRHERQLIEALPPDLGTWQKIANDGLKVLAREVQKLERDSKKPAPIEATRIRNMVAALKEAKPLASPAKGGEGDTATDDQGAAPSLLETLASQAKGDAEAETDSATASPATATTRPEEPRPVAA